jgi:hypothetical protein
MSTETGQLQPPSRGRPFGFFRLVTPAPFPASREPKSSALDARPDARRSAQSPNSVDSGPLSPRPPPIFPASPLQLEVGPQDQSSPMVPRALKMQDRRSDPPLKAGDLDFYVPLLPTS